MKRSSIRKHRINKLALSVMRQIKGTLGRYLAIFAIIALGVGFFAGLRVSTDAMLQTADDYFREKELFDFRLISTLGLTEEDVAAFNELEGVQLALGSVNADFLCSDSEGDIVFRAHQLTEEMNRVDLLAGRMPKAGNECLLDAKFFDKTYIGKDLVFSEGNPEETLDTFAYTSYHVVGLINAPYYANFERGTTTLGQGRVTGFLYLPAEGFKTDYYTEIFLRIPGEGETGSDAYQAVLDKAEPSLSKLLEERAALRHDSLKGEAETKIADAQDELDEGRMTYHRERANAEREFADALEKLVSARKELDDGRKKLEDGKAELAVKKADAKKQFSSARKKLNQGWNQLERGKNEFNTKKTEAEQGFAAAQAELDAAYAQITQGEAQLGQLTSLCDAGEALVQGINSAGLGYSFQSADELIAAMSGGDTVLIILVDKALKDYGMTSGSFSAVWNRAEAQLGQPLNRGVLAAMEAQLKDARTKYDAGAAKFAKEKTAAEAALSVAEKQISDSEQQLIKGEQDYFSGKQAANEAIASAEQEIQNGEKELADGEKEYAEGLKKYEDSRAEADRKFADAEKELADGEKELNEAKEKLKEIEDYTTYVLDRSSNIGCATLESDMGIVRGVSRVFPLFFFLVAALVCVTTMTRMVDEQRTQNGVLMALGYGNGAIAFQYLFYAGSASILGCIIGFLLGSRFLPMALWRVYQIMYSIDRPIAYVLDWKLFAVCTTIFLFAALGATYLVCRRDLRESPADLIRPKSPPAGKRILLERLVFFWKRVKFLHKVSIRNILRYKKRMIMMILGVGGCTALLLTGFGIRDSIQYIVDYQFDEIELYDCSLSFTRALNEADEEAFLSRHTEDIAEISFFHMSTMDLNADGKTIGVNAVVYKEPLAGFVDLHQGDKKLSWPKEGETVINNRIASEYGLKTGDVITLRTPELREVTLTVSGIFDNYIYDYAFIQEETFRSQLGSVPEIKTAYLNFAEGAEQHAAAASIAGDRNVAVINVSADMRERVSKMLQSMNYVVLIVLVCAGALAFIVLYNLTNISINERRREIATLKVLGFYPNESASYVFRENMILTGISALAGLPMGFALLWYVMRQIKISSFYFGCRATFLSFIISVVLTFVFAILVAFFLYFKLEKIDMADSLKAIE